MEKVKEFLTVKHGYGSGDGSGYGDGSGDGYGSGYGSGSGSSDDSGDGSGYGSGSGFKSFDGKDIHVVDGLQTIITKVVKNLAKGSVLMNDLTLRPCFIIKQNGKFAHGDTVEEARKAIMDKIFKDMDEEERIDMFWNEFSKGVSYPAIKFYEWHNKLTGSCEFGRKAFATDHNIDIDKDSFTVEEFIELTKNDFGGDIISKLV